MTRRGEGRGSFVLESEENAQTEKNQLIVKTGLTNLLVGPPGFEPGTNGL
jgi:hypothetical protein